jgi:hypothetical protein
MANTTRISEAAVHRLCRDVDGRLLLARKSALAAVWLTVSNTTGLGALLHA